MSQMFYIKTDSKTQPVGLPKNPTILAQGNILPQEDNFLI